MQRVQKNAMPAIAKLQKFNLQLIERANQ